MVATIIKGKEIAIQLKNELKEKLNEFSSMPCLLSIRIGDDHASDVYIKAQSKVAQELGIRFIRKDFSSTCSEEKILSYIRKMNQEEGVTSIILQHPVPDKYNYKSLLLAIDPCKDAESIHPENLGNIFSRNNPIGPCTPMAVMRCLQTTGLSLYGKEAVVVGHSKIVGKPLGILLLNEGATVSTCHIGTSERGNLQKHVKRAEILIVAVGVPHLIPGAWIKKGAVVIDVGINKHKGKIVGDIEFETALERAKFITPVPGGVGRLTVLMLMNNVIEQFKCKKHLL